MKKVPLFVFVSALFALGGCFSSGSGRGTGIDPVDPEDGGTGGNDGGGNDGGGIVLLDSGPTGIDAGTTTLDTGTTPDTGIPTGECANPMGEFPAEAAARCSEATRTCINACTDSACLDACTTADTTAPLTSGGQSIDCGFCINYVQLQCIDANGCHDEWAAVSCCLEEKCADAADINTCASSQCRTQVTAWQDCAQSTAGTACLGLPTSGPYEVCYTAG